jgi:hypothetical protein
MPKGLEKQIAVALKDTERWLAKQPAWPNGHLTNASGSVVSHRGPTILSVNDAILQFARQLNKAGVPWRDIHLDLVPGQWLVNPAKIGARPPRIDLAIVDHKRLAERTKPFSPSKTSEPLFDAVFEFKLASNFWDRERARGRKPTPPKRVAASIETDTAKVRSLLDTLIAARGYVVIVEEADHKWDRPSTKPIDGLSTHFLRCF